MVSVVTLDGVSGEGTNADDGTPSNSAGRGDSGTSFFGMPGEAPRLGATVFLVAAWNVSPVAPSMTETGLSNVKTTLSSGRRHWKPATMERSKSGIPQQIHHLDFNRPRSRSCWVLTSFIPRDAHCAYLFLSIPSKELFLAVRTGTNSKGGFQPLGQ